MFTFRPTVLAAPLLMVLGSAGVAGGPNLGQPGSLRLWHARAGRLRCVAADGLGHYSVLEAAIIIDPLPICLALTVGRTGLRHRLAIDRRLRSHRLQVVGRARTFCTIGRGER